MDSGFELAYTQMMEFAVKSSSEERKRRLLEADQAEKLFLKSVWWPAVGILDFLHPEYELQDLKGGARFADFAYMPPLPYRLLIEIDGFGPHWRDVSRWRFADDLQRQNHLLIDGWHLLRFAYDDISEKPRRCQQTLLMALAKWGGITRGLETNLDVYERALLHLMQQHWGEITPRVAAEELGISKRRVYEGLKSLVKRGILSPETSVKGRSMRYRFSSSNWSNSLRKSIPEGSTLV
ncbi:helix-turn-helix domain-containing protein [Paenibacillus albus]|uniref:DNA-binding response regulator n=1 Tax=Paenibacillus albus TaxID=2495582 RepID=UPI0015AFC157|nr:DNA-binding response regulator [Paenibacillus albus]